MSIQDKIERILKDIHLLFANGKPYKGNKGEVVVKKQEALDLLSQLNLAIYEAMDQYEVTCQKQELSERRCEKKGEELIGTAKKHAADVYASSIIYTDDALSRIQHMMEDANDSVEKIFRQLNREMAQQKDKVRQNKSELKGQLQNFADSEKYLKIVEEQNREREKELHQEIDKNKGKRIKNEGKTYASIQPEIKINKAYFDKNGKDIELVEIDLEESGDEVSKSLAKVTGKEFAESLRRRAAQKSELQNEENIQKESSKSNFNAEVKVDLNAEYFKQKQGEVEEEEKKDWRIRLGKTKSGKNFDN
ncbi:MAG: hypothetical protein RSD28_01835 [Lachnospiraceae bacterium]